MNSPRHSSTSLFKQEKDACHSLEKAQARLQAEKQHRMKMFRRVGLPLCLAGFVVIAYVLKDAFISLFKEDHLVQQYIEAEKKHQHGSRQEQSPEQTVKTFGRKSAGMKIELTLPASGRGIQEAAAPVLEAVDTKPSEIYLIWNQNADAEPELKINGSSRVEILVNGKTEAIELRPGMNGLALRQALNGMHAVVYGKNVLHPLQLRASAAEEKGSEETDGEYLPEFVSSKKDLKDHRKQTLLLLPKADNEVVPDKKQK